MLVTLLSTILIAAPVQSAPPAQEPAPGSETLNMIQTTIIPPRDRIDLARRLLGVTNIPEPPTTAHPNYRWEMLYRSGRTTWIKIIRFRSMPN